MSSVRNADLDRDINSACRRITSQQVREGEEPACVMRGARLHWGHVVLACPAAVRQGSEVRLLPKQRCRFHNHSRRQAHVLIRSHDLHISCFPPAPPL